MRKGLKNIIIGLVILTLIGCGGKKNEGVELSLTIDRELPAGGIITVYELTDEGMKPIDSLVASDEGFETQLSLEKESFIRLDIARQGMVNLILDSNEGQVAVNINGSDVVIVGSKPSTLVNDIDLIRAKFQNDTQQLNQVAIQASQQGDDLAFQAILGQYAELEKKHKEDIKEKTQNADGSLATLYGLNFLEMEAEAEFFKQMIERVENKLPDHFWLLELKETFEKAEVLAIGKEAPDFSLETPEGDMLALSDLKGKYVLIDFWAAWCGPCRKENPNVVAAYNKFGGENFEILGVSLDRTRQAWLKAIEDDGLPWKHVSDLQYFNSEAAKLYQINAIPATYLIDPKGKIIAKNLRGESLTSKLEELFGE